MHCRTQWPPGGRSASLLRFHIVPRTTTPDEYLWWRPTNVRRSEKLGHGRQIYLDRYGPLKLLAIPQWSPYWRYYRGIDPTGAAMVELGVERDWSRMTFAELWDYGLRHWLTYFFT